MDRRRGRLLSHRPVEEARFHPLVRAAGDEATKDDDRSNEPAPQWLRCSRIARCVRLLASLAAMFAGLPPSSSELTERKSVVPPSPPADRRRERRESDVVVTLRERWHWIWSLRSRACSLIAPPIVGRAICSV